MKSSPDGMMDWNTMSMDEYVIYLTQKFQIDSSETAKAVFELIDFIINIKIAKLNNLISIS